MQRALRHLDTGMHVGCEQQTGGNTGSRDWRLSCYASTMLPHCVSEKVVLLHATRTLGSRNVGTNRHLRASSRSRQCDVKHLPKSMSLASRMGMW
mmetsp:Transcript_49393/g.122741  ORF Transcript_49393/g.122741 Transcript_49393/m.122741 type:complete len:95 (-) Transcript_49393:150-434(-)